MLQYNDQLPVGSLAQLVGAFHRYHRGQGSNPGKPDFFQAFLLQLKSSISFSSFISSFLGSDV